MDQILLDYPDGIQSNLDHRNKFSRVMPDYGSSIANHSSSYPYTDMDNSSTEVFSDDSKSGDWQKDSYLNMNDYYDDPSTIHHENGPFRRLHEHANEDDKSYDDSHFSRRGHRGSARKLFCFILLGLCMIYGIMYKKVESRNECKNNDTFLPINGKSHVTVVLPSLHENHTLTHGFNRHNLFKKILSSSRKGSVLGWSYNTSRDTRSYVFPDNMTLLNQPKSVCKNNIQPHSTIDAVKRPQHIENSSETFLVVIICSKMENFPARSAIRLTWANQSNYEALSKRLQTVMHSFENVNITEKILNDLNSIANITYTDKRVKRDLKDYNVYNEAEDAVELNVNLTVQLGMELDKKRTKRDLPSFISADDVKDNIYLKNSLKEEEGTDGGDDPRFDHGSNKIPTTVHEKDNMDNPVLGNFEENEVDKNENFDYYEDQTEVSNVMKIPPKGERYHIDEEAIKNARNIVKLSTNGDKLKLEFKNSEDKPKIDSKEESGSKSQEKIKNEPNLVPPVNVRFFFLLGQSSNENNTELQTKIDEEASIHDDIIQEGFVDSYNNLTLKSVMLLKWVVSNCKNNVRYIMKTDDDMYLNIPKLVEVLQNKSKEHLIKSMPSISANNKTADELYQTISPSQKMDIVKDEKLLMGDLICDAKPILDMSSKWYSPTYMYGGKFYPRYLTGTGYVMSFATAESLYKAALDIPLFHLEDIFITGMCSQKAGIKPIDHPGFSYAVRKFDPCIFAYLISAHQVSPRQLRRMHNLLMSSPIKLLEDCEAKRIFAKTNQTLAGNIKERLAKLNGPMLGSPKSFINGLINLGIADTKLEKLGSVASKRRKRPNNGCF